MQSRDASILKHIVKYCLEINNELNEISCEKEQYCQNTVYRNSLALCVLQIGELVGLLSDDFKADNPEIDWKSIKGMRNVVAHKYGSFDFDVLWETVTEDIPKLHNYCKEKITNIE